MLDNLDVQNKYNQQAGIRANNFGMNVVPGVNTPNMQAQIDVSKINEAAADSYIGQRISSFEDIDPLVQYGVAIPTWIVINQAMDRYLKLCRGNYDKSVIYKIGSFGDKVSNILFDNPVGRTMNRIANGGKSIFKHAVYNNSAVLRAFNETPSIPELGMVKSQTGGIKTMLSHDNTNIWEEFTKPLKHVNDFDSLGASKKEIEAIKARLDKVAGAENRKIAMQAEEFKLLEKTSDPKRIAAFKNLDEKSRLAKLKEIKIKAIGFKDLKEYELIKAAPEKHIDRVLEILNKTDKKLFARISYSNKNFGSVLKGEIAGRKVYFSELYNKLYGATGGNHKTLLGRTMVKLSNSILEGASSRIQGGKMAALMQAYFLAEAIIRASRQETNGDKFKSFMERFAELIGFFVFIPPSLKLMHALGGMQYSGMTPKQIEEYRKAVEEFNKHVMNCDWTKDVYKVKRKELRAKFRPGTKNPLVYLSRKAGDIITVGLEQVRPYTKHKVDKVDLTITKVLENPKLYLKSIPKRLADVMRNPKYWLKQMAGYPMRFGLPMFVFVPFLNKYLVKGVNAIFGKPKEGLADEGKYEEQKEAKAQQQELNNQIPAQPVQASSAAVMAANQRKKPAQISYTGSLKDEETTKQNNEKKAPDIPEHRYIPSTDGVKLKNQDKTDAELEKALKRLETAEKAAYIQLGD